MPSWIADLFGDVLAVQVVAWIAAAVLLGVVIGKAWPRLRQLVKLVDSLSALPGFMEKTTDELESQTEKIKEIHHEVNYNGGGSVKDAVSELRETVVRLDENVSRISEKIAPEREE